jgi:murein DD-endopeptidase MepM/ murein hydrolase activator NlpD
VNRRVVAIAAAAFLLGLPGAMSTAQTAYRYRDSNGQWVFTDQAPASTAPADSFTVGHEKSSLHLAVNREDDAEFLRLIAVNDCLCVATFRVEVVESGQSSIAAGTQFQVTLAPATRQALWQAKRAGPGGADLKYVWRVAIGSPDAAHRPERPYRVPFGIGSTYPISQAFPSRITHTTADSRYAVDIALPDGTPVYSAREGLVINAQHDFFRSAAAAVMLDQANVVEILHDDGTIALYAHLHWDSIRVRIGEHVVRGQYIADSGKTGFASGPHLHFAVIRNTGLENVSVPVQFGGPAGTAVTPVTDAQLTAY